jgi:hypothetical protein
MSAYQCLPVAQVSAEDLIGGEFLIMVLELDRSTTIPAPLCLGSRCLGAWQLLWVHPELLFLRMR